MSETFRSSAQPSLFDYPRPSQAPPDEHYSNHEHPTSRRRVDSPTAYMSHYPGDGFDFRRPVMSASDRDGSSRFGMSYGPEEPIDLTDERLAQNLPDTHLATGQHTESDAEAPGPSTHAQRLPRFHRDIIDLADSEDEEQTQAQEQPQDPRIFGYPVAHDDESLFIPEAQPRPTTAGLRRPGFVRRPSAPMDQNDVEFVASRPLSRVASRRPTPARGSSRTPNPNMRNTIDPSTSATIDLTADDDDDDEVIHTNTRALPGVNGDRPAMAGSGIGTREPPAQGRGLGRLLQHMRATRPGMAEDIFTRYGDLGNDALARLHADQAEARQRHERAREHTQNLQVHLVRAQERLMRNRENQAPPPRPRAAPIINIGMDYGLVGFDLGFGAAPPRPPTPKYDPPPPAEKGFTRSPEENEEVVCPNCGDELALGSGEVKQQVYVVKSCGHVSFAPTLSLFLKST